MKIARAGLLLAGLLTFAATAEAVPLVGSFSKIGNFLPVDAAGNVVNIDDAVALDFTTLFGLVPSPGVAGTFLVTSSSGSFLVLAPAGSIGTVQDITFAPPGPFPTAPLAAWEITVGGLTVDLATIVVTSQTFDGALGQLVLDGTLVFNAPGFDPTPGVFTLTANQGGAVGGNPSATFSFSSSQVAVVAPEPGSLLLFGMALVGTGAAARRRFARK